MQNNFKLRRFAFKISSFLIAAMAVSASLLGFINEVELTSSTYNSWPEFILLACATVQTHSLILFIIIIILTVISIFVNKLGDPWVWEKLQFILNEYQAIAFSDQADEPNHHHRVTLFKYKPWHFFFRHCSGKWYNPWGKHWPNSGWLVPVLRSGYTSQKTNVVFCAPDNADETEGVAGRAWASQSAVVLNRLPSLKKSSPKRDINNYCKVTSCPKELLTERINAGKPMPMSMAATPIEVNGNIWGVVVLDSRADDSISDESILNYQLTVSLIGQLLEKTI